MSGLSREVLKWIQSLDLTWQLKTPKCWGLMQTFVPIFFLTGIPQMDGYLVAEIFSWYFPQDIQMHSYNNGTSLDSKLKNWSLLKNFIKKHHLDIPEELLEGTIHCKEGASHLMLERMYEILTNRQIKKTPLEYEIDFTDHAYQSKLPMHARSTASKAIKNNLRITEIMADGNLIASAQKAQRIINKHVEHRGQERYENPQRFNIKPTIGELSIRRPPPQAATKPDTDLNQSDMANEAEHADIEESAKPLSREPTVQFKEVEVKQLNKSVLYNMPIHGY